MKVLIFALVFLLSLPSKFSYCTNTKSLSNLNTRYICLMDYESGRVLYEKNSRMIVPMASTTKILTAIVALENSKYDEVVTVSERASSIAGSTIGLKKDQKITMEELLYGLMLRSGNDCAIAIAEHMAGSVERFSFMMDSKAFDIGAFNTHFATPHGLDADGHFTTAYDMALITRCALKNPEFAKIVSTKDIVINGINGSKGYHNINKILWQLEGADGVKTGFTNKAGKCLVSSATRNGVKVINVALNSYDRWKDSTALLDYGLKNFKESILLSNKEFGQLVPVKSGNKKLVQIGFDEEINLPITSDEKEDIYIKKIIPYTLEAPLHEGQNVGSLIIYSKDKKIFSMPYKILEEVKAVSS
ncbi:D-alanyl-D-alanine carboxypeptidase DacB precursor [Oxobacter pfennigii]|uniref:serine-type D-Ala-D-Ala carboxypeptidase n=1 Tax=Oxobacter pfennigii TaxID=36849 RepID=A0A0P8X230_9CLOT|nr:D-alanyl-D-alanine carboxypeptidase family protein [Oxobacter pfennigii]KPU44868.1 D-alanyl-D-alanine carboxypeptidase DacB precursor [Oxobacter pfennigii]